MRPRYLALAVCIAAAGCGTEQTARRVTIDTTTTTTTAKTTTSTRPQPTTTTVAATTTTTTRVTVPTTPAPTIPATVPVTTPAWPHEPRPVWVGGRLCSRGCIPTSTPCAIPHYICVRESNMTIDVWNPSEDASGKYQFIRSTWAGYGGYINAGNAPEAVQDEKARLTWADGAGAFHWRL